MEQKTDSNRFKLGIIIITLWIGFVAFAAQAAEDDEMREEYDAFGVALGAGMSGGLDIVLTRWTTEEERELLANTLVEKGQEELVELLRKQDETGYVRSRGGRDLGGMPSVRLRYAFQFEQNGQREIIIVTDRPVRMGEVRRGDRSTDYDVSAIVMQMAKKGDKEEGEGTFLPAIKIEYDEEKKKLNVEALGQQPVRLSKITRRK